jgi:hypothetical protein
VPTHGLRIFPAGDSLRTIHDTMKTLTLLLNLATIRFSVLAADVTGTRKAELKEGKLDGDTVSFVEMLNFQATIFASPIFGLTVVQLS